MKLIVFDKQKTGKTNKNTKATGKPSTMAAMHFKWYLRNQVDDIDGNAVSPTKQAEAKKTLGETRLSRGASSPLAR